MANFGIKSSLCVLNTALNMVLGVSNKLVTVNNSMALWTYLILSAEKQDIRSVSLHFPMCFYLQMCKPKFM